jgi:outer membrane protein OmpA-like peptidoglycan-associated protein
MNLGKLAVAPSSSPSAASADEKPAAPQKAKSQPVPVTIGMVKLVKAAVTFRDDSVKPPVQTGLSDLTGTIKGLSSKQLARADVDLTGRVDKVAPLKIAGTINPLSNDAFTDLTISLGAMDLTVEGPYSGKYVGYGLSKGKLSLDLKYKVSKKQLEAENKVLVDQLTFGEKVDSPDATSLPVPLAVALLKNRKGQIEIDLPIRGDLTDPDFKYGKVVLSTLLNLLTKMVASPFSLIGKLVPGGGDGEELQFIEFDPGSSAVAGEETKKIDVLAKALEERPGLRLDITGTADATLDRDALRATKLTEQLRAMRQRERGKASTKDEALSIDDERRLVTELYEQRRNQLAASEPPQPAGAPSKPLTLQEMKHQLAASLPVDEAELRSLARQRAEQVRDQLIEVGKLAEERVFLQETDPTASGNEKVRSRLTITAGS